MSVVICSLHEHHAPSFGLLLLEITSRLGCCHSRRVCCHYQLPNNVVAAPDIVATTANLNHRHFETADLLELPTFRTPDVKITAEMSPDLMNPDVKQLIRLFGCVYY